MDTVVNDWHRPMYDNRIDIQFHQMKILISLSPQGFQGIPPFMSTQVLYTGYLEFVFNFAAMSIYAFL